MRGRLNAIQKSMLGWNEMHPYSAVHVAQVRGPLDEARLRSVIGAVLHQGGLSCLVLNGDRYSYQCDKGPVLCELQTLPGGEGAWNVLLAEIQRQLNLRFDHTQPFSPFRFLVVPAPDSFFLGVVYFHPAADAESVAWLLKDLVSVYLEGKPLDQERGLELYPDSKAHLLDRYPGVVARKLLSLPTQISNLRSSQRAPCRDAADLANGFDGFSLGPEDLGSLVAAAKRWKVTVNDLLLALLFQSLSPFCPGRLQARKRPNISLGCIVNLRKDLGFDRRRFGVFLGSFTVSHPVPEGVSLQTLASDVARQTARIKRDRLYLASSLELAFSRFMLRLFSPERRRKLYAKHYPLWGGITNMNLNRLWGPGEHPGLLDYFRGVSTGPVTPLALSVTTLGERMNLGLSYRTAVFSKLDIERFQSRFRDGLEKTRPHP